MAWTVSTAREHFAEVLKKAKKAPQPIYRRNKLVGGVVDAETMKQLAPSPPADGRTIEDAFAELRQILAETGETWPDAPERRDRPNPFAEEIDDGDL
jgi:dihydrodipicolinate synthase/N-acetylneuraminate lyase